MSVVRALFRLIAVVSAIEFAHYLLIYDVKGIDVGVYMSVKMFLSICVGVIVGWWQ